MAPMLILSFVVPLLTCSPQFHSNFFGILYMSGKRKESPNETTGREKKKQKTALARTIATQPPGGANAVAGSSKAVKFASMYTQE